jgi:hypothetical protein
MVEMQVWREDDRIRQRGGSGYSDLVSDAEIRKHMSQSFAAICELDLIDATRELEHLAFARAVLQLRARERRAAALPESPEATNNGD